MRRERRELLEDPLLGIAIIDGASTVVTLTRSASGIICTLATDRGRDGGSVRLRLFVNQVLTCFIDRPVSSAKSLVAFLLGYGSLAKNLLSIDFTRCENRCFVLPGSSFTD